jgi:hypothetical protein
MAVMGVLRIWGTIRRAALRVKGGGGSPAGVDDAPRAAPNLPEPSVEMPPEAAIVTDF